jgi:hypothetical protein
MVRPIDLQDNLAKTQAVERMNQIQKAHSEMGQRQVADALREKSTADMERTKANEKMDMVIIRDDQHKKESDAKNKKRKDTKSERPEEESSDHLDITG